MKQALIIGTSHSEATCVRNDGGAIERITDGRWYDYLKDEGYEITSLARAGCTPQQQFFATLSFLNDNPDKRWDIAIVEGRSLETNITIPVDTELCHPHKMPYENMYDRWMSSNGSRDLLAHADSHKILEYPELVPYFTSYVFSFQHAIDLWTCNYALCSMLSRVSTVVKWFAFSLAKKYSIDPTYKELIVGKDIMQPYLLPDGWPCVKATLSEDCFCACGHMNEKGHQQYWHNEIYPRLKNYI